MLNRLGHHKHDFDVYISKISFVEIHYNITSFVVYLENIIFQGFAHWKYQEKNVCIAGNFVSRSQNGTGSATVPPVNYDTDLHSSPVGGGALALFNFEELTSFIIFSQGKKPEFETQAFKYIGHLKVHEAENKDSEKNLLFCQMPLHSLVPKLSLNQLQGIAKQHHVSLLAHASKNYILKYFSNHNASCCKECVSVFELYDKISKKRSSKIYQNQKATCSENGIKDIPTVYSQLLNDNQLRSSNPTFPPLPPSAKLRQKIIKDFCEATTPSQFTEAGCAVCGALVVHSNLIHISNLDSTLNHLSAEGYGFTCLERKSPSDQISELDGPIVDQDCKYICKSCRDTVKRGKIPKFALACGLWLGRAPHELQDLSFAEQLLISRVRHNRCIFRVAKGMHKMIANAVTFEHPMQKMYAILPPPIEELNEMLAFIYTGPCQPTEDDFRRIPLLVHQNKVGKALDG
jgi:hypothetical protein